ncbi:MAG: nucleotide exchange factor GrpE [Gammaproteobacteria bacterium]|nr:nucleotide exchange factor GrpE [Gammaproteobacteria bacterium]
MNGQAQHPDESKMDSDELENSELDADADQTGEAEAASEAIDPLQAAEAKAAENWDRYLRAAAETENVRKRATRDVENAHKYAIENFGRELLAVKDSLEMGIQAADDADAAALLAGKAATLKVLATTLERFGIEEIDPEGEPFDPERHQAMTMQPSEEVEPGSVLSVIQKGYLLNGRLLRPAMVVVAAEPPGRPAED